ncbi:conjugative relaxase-like TrwC/TraI family protein [Arthrobacter sp. PvP102]|uniref:MobF family relaxase n=1 Tax=unclassified Arthrobacter TaxID=235627 RepID=UPI001AE219F4|nr:MULTISPECIES: MobF family relaxase [unclassified Arthrobacter]MBP1235221.1 conjugative relaxase-like TrwC/TraI family protein [Arthrobacter sp. PvP103]MBP1236180.1 conjugative relaxase-like TrwC/TraI family protein [Arthrobacter sp. PvP102]
MTMSIARLSAQSGLKYLFKTTMMDDLTITPADATTYYMKAGTPQGRWLGSGVRGINRTAGDVVTESDAKAIFDHATHPDTGAFLGRPHGQPTVVQNSHGRAETRHAVVGFDLTFSVPKSVSILWALSPRTLQDQILETHHQAVDATLEWLETYVIHTRAGRNGVAHLGTRGAIAAAFDHWESRAGDPQLHTHMVIANRIQRITDGAWVTLDSRTLYKAAVAASEHYNGLLFDALHRNLGTDTDVRVPAANTHNPSQQLTGVDEALIHEFSNRSRLIDLETDRLVAEWTASHGTPPTATTTIKLRQQATLSTRTAKSETAVPLHQLSAQWRARAAARGFESREVLANTIRRSRIAPFRTCDFTPDWVDAVGSLTRERVATKRATWNRWNLLAEAERVCAEIRCHTPADRHTLIDAIASAAEAQSVPLNEYRYTLPANAQADLRFADHSIFDFHGSRLYTDAATLANEDVVLGARNDDGGPAVSASVAMESLASYKHGGRLDLHSDQRAAAANVLLSGHRLDAVVGPAGTGKTTTLGAVKAAWESEFGAGTVVGLAPAAASAEVLGRELALTTENVAKWLYESVGQGAGNRAAQFFDTEQRLTKLVANEGPHATRLVQRATRLTAEQDRWRFHPNQLVVIDEASMVSTLQLSALVQQARDAGAKVLLVGDPAQLDAIDAGGVLGWLDRQGKTVRLSTIWRFEQAWEQDSSLRLRAGDFAAIADYDSHGRIQHGAYLDMVDQAYLRWQTDIHAGKSSILIAADNDTVGMLNQRAQADRLVQGAVDAESSVRLSDGLRAGTGDTVIARHNDRAITDSSGDFIRNGTMLDVVRTGRHDGSLTAVRRDTGATISLSRDYVGASVELGYATTAHRSQGITVDTGHTVVTQGRLTRELLYVSMTRGRTGNHAYVSENDPLDDEPTDPAMQASWRQILGEVLAAEGAERTAHEVRDAEQSKADSLERLSAEYDYLAQLAAAEDLREFLEAHSPGGASELQQSPSWGAALAAWRRSVGVSRPSAQRVVAAALDTSSSTRDTAAVLHSRLRQFLSVMPAGGIEPLAEQLCKARPDLDNMINQVQARVHHRMDQVTTAAMMSDAEWKRNLLEALGPFVTPEEATGVLRRTAIYRDRWGIDESPLPLGPVPAAYEWEQQEQRAYIDRLVERAGVSSPNPVDAPTWAEDPVTWEDRLINVGWQL